MEDTYVKKVIRTPFSRSYSDSPTSKTSVALALIIQFLNCLGLVVWITLLTCEARAYAQQLTTAKIPKLGEIVFRDRVTLGAGREAFRQRLHELGYVEGKNIIFETRSAKGSLDRFSELAQELVNLKVDVLVASSTGEALAFKHATSTIPIVFMIATDPVGEALVSGLAHPGGNITGITTSSTMLSGKRLELLRESVPKLLRVAVLWNPQDPNDAQQWKESQLAARELGLQLSSIEVSSAEKYEAGFKEATRARSGALTLITGPLASAHQKQIASLAAKFRLPAIYPRRDFVENGGLISYGPDRAESYRHAAVMVDKILKGAKPADLPVEQPTKFELVINLKTAKQIGLNIPPNVLARADRIIR